MAVCLENGAWIVEAQGFFMRHQFGLTSWTYDARQCVLPPSGDGIIRWICPTIWRRQTLAQAPAARFLLFPPIFRERDASSRRGKAKPFGRPSSPDGLAPATLLASW